jgi:putative ABC transport system permease protein
MFARMLWRSMSRFGRASSALVAIIVAAAAATAMLNLFVDVQAKLHNEFRRYGANVVVASKDGQSLPDNALSKAQSIAGSGAIVVPFSYVVARTNSGQPVVVGGTDLEAARQLNSWWSATAWPNAPGQALVGSRAAHALGLSRQPFALNFHGKTMHLTPAGALQTGAAEDSRIYISQSDFENWTGIRASTIQIAIPGSAQEISNTIAKLSQALRAADVQPVRQITEGEANVLGKTRSTMLYSAILIIGTAVLCLFTTLMGWVYERRRDFALMKALGSSTVTINSLFAAEAVSLGVAGALIGYVVGVGIAAWIGRVNFHAAIVPRWNVLPPVLLGSIALSLISTVVPILLLRRVQPANILRGE